MLHNTHDPLAFIVLCLHPFAVNYIINYVTCSLHHTFSLGLQESRAQATVATRIGYYLYTFKIYELPGGNNVWALYETIVTKC